MKFYSTLNPDFSVDVPFSAHELCGFVESSAEFPVWQDGKHMHVTLHSATFQKGNTTIVVRIVPGKNQIAGDFRSGILTFQTIQAR